MRSDRSQREILRKQIKDLNDVELTPVGPPLWAVLVIVMGIAVLLCGIVAVVVAVTHDGPHGRIVVVSDSSQPACTSD